MILVDTSVWVEHLRSTQSRAHLQFRELMTSKPGSVAICEPIVMELLADPTDPFVVGKLEDQLGTLEDLSFENSSDFRSAAAIARDVRRSGHTVRAITDCLIAAVALRWEAPVWHCDEDFVRIAAVTPLLHRDLR